MAVPSDLAPGRPALAAIVAGLPASTPFVGPEALERRLGRPLGVRLGANESLFGPSARVIEAMRAAALDINLYGDPEGFELRTALARHHALTLDHVVLGSGIDELLGLLVRAYLEPGGIAVMSLGGYPTFVYQVSGHGGRIETVPYRDDRNDAEGLVEAARRVGAKLLYLSNPDNPSGSYLTGATICDMVDRLPRGCLLVLDEAYAEFAPADAIPDIAADDPRVVRLRTFSKAHGLAGMRVGYAFGAPETIRPLDRIRNQFGVGRMAQAAALAALADQDHVATVVAAVAAGRADYAALARELGAVALPSATNFVTIDVGGSVCAKTILAALLEREGVFIRMPGAAPLDRCIRVTVGRPEERTLFAAAFRRVFACL
ncbi:MAG TPA: aminotransferase class I/II-fold pyridoxal phosphate-dependent enzyme [Aliidongia sp.]|uniref:aminotransferase class I/II-fold pyridoxal phosphate-dependent enzyme n=1 Tax=Aliidongia sp. TaxID=1914230 RepID=UPI002DDD0CF7|nr:aminotransferase class I/II-fold pyridoxal phosphate-dependent enzyme [Aliidongia sp.]HEV2676449.1 aminotransferase class I/II-fold pyridoxal phosphate-dependent enzyme [Aliidongia sp.]